MANVARPGQPLRPLNRKTRQPKVWSALAGLFALLSACTGHAQTYCVYDPLGAQGDYFSLAKDYQLAAKRWNVNLEITPYTDDDKLYQDFKSGRCDMASMLGMRAREFNRFTGTLDAPSVIENYAQLRNVMGVMASPKLARLMTNGDYEIVGIVPVGALYPVVNDRSINSFDKATGRKVGVFAWDHTQTIMADYFHVTPVPLALSDYGRAFNTGKVDVIVVPLILFKAMELEKGLGSNGGIVRRAIFQLSMQMVSHASKFPPAFGQSSRDYMLAQVDHTLSIIRNQEAAVEPRLWIYAMKAELVKWQTGMRQLSQQLVQQGYYDEHMLQLLQRIRCNTDKEEPECASQNAEAAR